MARGPALAPVPCCGELTSAVRMADRDSGQSPRSLSVALAARLPAASHEQARLAAPRLITHALRCQDWRQTQRKAAIDHSPNFHLQTPWANQRYGFIDGAIVSTECDPVGAGTGEVVKDGEVHVAGLYVRRHLEILTGGKRQTKDQHIVTVTIDRRRWYEADDIKARRARDVAGAIFYPDKGIGNAFPRLQRGVDDEGVCRAGFRRWHPCENAWLFDPSAQDHIVGIGDDAVAGDASRRRGARAGRLLATSLSRTLTDLGQTASSSLNGLSSLIRTRVTTGGVVSDGGVRTKKRRAALLSVSTSSGSWPSGSTVTRAVPIPEFGLAGMLTVVVTAISCESPG